MSSFASIDVSSSSSLESVHPDNLKNMQKKEKSDGKRRKRHKRKRGSRGTPKDQVQPETLGGMRKEKKKRVETAKSSLEKEQTLDCITLKHVNNLISLNTKNGEEESGKLFLHNPRGLEEFIFNPESGSYHIKSLLPHDIKVESEYETNQMHLTNFVLYNRYIYKFVENDTDDKVTIVVYPHWDGGAAVAGELEPCNSYVLPFHEENSESKPFFLSVFIDDGHIYFLSNNKTKWRITIYMLPTYSNKWKFILVKKLDIRKKTDSFGNGIEPGDVFLALDYHGDHLYVLIDYFPMKEIQVYMKKAPFTFQGSWKLYKTRSETQNFYIFSHQLICVISETNIFFYRLPSGPYTDAEFVAKPFYFITCPQPSPPSQMDLEFIKSDEFHSYLRGDMRYAFNGEACWFFKRKKGYYKLVVGMLDHTQRPSSNKLLVLDFTGVLDILIKKNV